jgi:hypothetical protein
MKEQNGINWKNWQSKKAYIRLKSGRVYTADIKLVDDSDRQIIFLHLVDKFGAEIIVVHSQIIEIREVSS